MSKVYNVMVVGCGAISNEWFPVLAKRPDANIVAVVDIRPESAKARIEQYGISCPIYTDFDEALATVKPDVVVDLTFPMCHHDITVKSLRAGVNVFGEKPMAMTREEAQDMLKVAKETGKVYDVLQNRRFLPGIRALKEAVDSGILGDIWMTNCEIYVNSDLASVRNSLPYPMLQDQAIHSFDSARFILSADATSVYTHSYRTKDSHYGGTPGDNAGACIFEMSNGSVLVFNAVMDTDYMKTAWHSQFRIIGTKGTAIWNGFDQVAHAEIRQSDGSIAKMDLKPNENWKGIEWHEGAIDEMFCDLESGKESAASCFHNYGSVAMEYSALDSIKSGKKEEVR